MENDTDGGTSAAFGFMKPWAIAYAEDKINQAEVKAMRDDLIKNMGIGNRRGAKRKETEGRISRL